MTRASPRRGCTLLRSGCKVLGRLNRKMPPSIQVRSYAKINWTLDVLYKREDGYHELRTIYQTVSLHDTLSVTETAGPIEIICDDSRVPCNETNLAVRAVEALRQAIGSAKG